ncbi:hypothetical protein FHS96_005581 [Sphingomonas zeicaulis]|uniref:hypothetical protein n=1 Tax=Sphingomonas zeicaulis TaxID=1632740 RepID=UPI003D1EE3ED
MGSKKPTLPTKVCTACARDVSRLTIKTLGEIADEFQASKTATLIKIVATDRFPVLMVCTTRAGRKWFRGSPSDPGRWYPRNDVSSDSLAFDMLYGNKPESSVPRPVKASAWFDRDAGGFTILEQSFKVADAEVTSILTLTDKKTLAD